MRQIFVKPQNPTLEIKVLLFSLLYKIKTLVGKCYCTSVLLAKLTSVLWHKSLPLLFPPWSICDKETVWSLLYGHTSAGICTSTKLQTKKNVINLSSKLRWVSELRFFIGSIFLHSIFKCVVIFLHQW